MDRNPSMDLSDPFAVETQTAHPASLAALVRATAAAQPTGTALLFGQQTMSYRELDERSDAVAAAVLHALGSDHARDAVVGLLARRSIDAILGQIGIMKAGAAYLPFDADTCPSASPSCSRTRARRCC